MDYYREKLSNYMAVINVTKFAICIKRIRERKHREITVKVISI